ncbi:MAG: YkgJ family cysteine cluster protein [Desulfobacteraceae bacterium]|nr:MAG: YkgJ family cysteine cluster protein [Desulfobacteraceae bacterium]
MGYDTLKPDDIFKCTMCGECCKGYGGTYVTDKDIVAIAGYISADSKSFVSKYCDMSGGKPLLARGGNGCCVFWDKVCTIHPVKPRMCRQWPFIKSVLADVDNWYVMAGMCPGIRTDVPANLVRECVSKELSKSN